MAEEDKHYAIGKKNLFCAVPGKPCECGNNYRDNCNCSWAAEAQYPVGVQGILRGYEAHHVLSVSRVNVLPKQRKKQEALIRVLKVTPWCINNQKNMLAMPLWGHTVLWYCDPETQDFRRRRSAPPFKNIPQHDFEHNSNGGYCDDVEKAIRKLWDQVAEAEKKHKDSKNGIKGKLDSLSKTWKDKLKAYGEREGGTHEAWRKARKDPDSSWYLPFSMASDAHAESRHFPFTEELEEKLQKILDSLIAPFL